VDPHDRITLGVEWRFFDQPDNALQPADPTPPGASARGTGVRAMLLRTAGFAFFALGTVGMVVPLLPTTIFWILAVWAFAGSSPKWRQRILSHPKFGPAVGDFVDHRILRRRGKWYAVVGIYGGLSLSSWLLKLPALWAWGLAVALLPVAIYLASRPETPPTETGG
jgi:uncharacterized membrane protein YbaN (DUF454 family)